MITNSTCIIGYNDKKKKVLYIGGDSAGVSNFNIVVRKDSKVFKVSRLQRNIIIGYTSSFRMGQLLRYKFAIPEQNKSQSDYEYMVTAFIDATIRCLKNNNYTTLKDGSISGGCFIVGYRNSLYVIEEDFQVGEVYDNFVSVGCGEILAKGAMAVLDTLKINPKEKVLKALEIVSKYNGAICPPFNIVEMKY